MPGNDIDSTLREWAKWSRGGFGALGASASSWVVDVRKGVVPNITDDMALQVDAAVIALGEHDKNLRYVIELSYVRRLGVIEIGLKLNCSRSKVDKFIAEGCGFISGRLSVFSEAA